MYTQKTGAPAKKPHLRGADPRIHVLTQSPCQQPIRLLKIATSWILLLFFVSKATRPPWAPRGRKTFLSKWKNLSTKWQSARWTPAAPPRASFAPRRPEGTPPRLWSRDGTGASHTSWRGNRREATPMSAASPLASGSPDGEEGREASPRIQRAHRVAPRRRNTR
jgi:hypothetical protein